jgi:zinc transport system substrate-binding protein
MRTFIVVISIIGLMISVFGLNVGVSIPPQKFFVEQIGGDIVQNITVLVKPGMSAHNFEISPKQLIDLSKADVFFAIGLEFEQALLEKLKNINKDILIVDISKSVQKIPMEAHSHKHENHKHNRLDPHVWTSVKNAQKMGKLIQKIFLQKLPSEKEYFDKNYERFLILTVELDNKIKQLLNKKIENRSFMIFHPAWGYFARDYDLEQIPIEIEGKEPGPEDLKNIFGISQKYNIKTIFVEPFHQSHSPKVIAGFINANISEIYPLAEQWDSNLLKVAQKIRESLER